MKLRTGSIIAHLVLGFGAGYMGIVGFISGPDFFSVGKSFLPSSIILPILGVGGVLVFLGGIGIITKKKLLSYMGLIGDIIFVLLGIIGLEITLTVVGVLLVGIMISEMRAFSKKVSSPRSSS